MLLDETYDDLDPSHFADPSAAYRLHPWWFWNGEMAPDLMRKQIAEMADKGCGGFYISCRQGLALPYQSEEYFDRVRLARDEARERGMLFTGIMDEYPYPSGMAGGAVTWHDPRFLRSDLDVVDFEAEGAGPVHRLLGQGDLLRAVAVPLKRGRPAWDDAVDLAPHVGVRQVRGGLTWGRSLTAYSYARFGTHAPQHELLWQAPRGRWRIMLFLARRSTSHKYFGEYVDLLNPDAVEHFLELTLGRYQRALGAPLGESMRSIFTDETYPGSWTWDLPAHFRERCGYDLVEALPALVDDAFPDAARVRFDYVSTIHDLFMDAFHNRYRDWCERLGVLYTTEVPMIRNADQSAAHIPGLDHAHDRIGEGQPHGWQTPKLTSFRHSPKFVASHAAQAGKPRVAVEAFHSLGWGVRIADLKALIDRMSALGVNLTALHGFYYQSGGMQKFDAAPSEFYQHPWWQHFRELADYAARLSYIASRGRYVADIAVLDPVTSTWTMGGDQAQLMKRLGAAESLHDDWSYIIETLLTNQRDFHHLDPLDLAKSRVRGRSLHVGHARYRAVVVPPLANLERAAWDKLRAFMDEGGTVLWLGTAPWQEIEQDSPVVAEVRELLGRDPADLAREHRDGTRAKPGWLGNSPMRLLVTGGPLREANAAAPLLAALDEAAPATIEVQAPEQWRDHTLVHERECDGSRIFLIANCSPAEFTSRVRLRLPRAWALQRWDAETGASHPLSSEREDDRLVTSVLMPAHGTTILIAERAEAEAPAPPAEPRPATVDLSGRWSLAETPRNFLRIGKFRVQLGLGPVQTSARDYRWPIVPPQPIINTIADLAGDQPLPIRISPGGMTPKGFAVQYPQVVTWRAHFHADVVPDDLRLLLDRHGLAGDAQVFVNGERVPLESFEEDFAFDYSNISAPVAGLVVPGRNVVAIVMQVHADDGGLLDAIWLAGSFGVQQARPAGHRLVEAPVQVWPLDLDASRLPHFSGTLTLERAIQMRGDETEIDLAQTDDAFLDCAELSLNGQSLGARCWPPYRWPLPEGLARAGANDLRLAITTSAGRVIEAMVCDPHTGEYREA